jgi:tetratricopeptide (TPR) repeat protein
MRDTCYNRREILDLLGTEPHLQTCGACRGIFEQSRIFLKDFSDEVNALGPLMATMDRENGVKGIVEGLDAVPENERLAYIKEHKGMAPGMVLKLCDRSKKHLLISPNESERWLRLAGSVLAQVKQQGFFHPKDVQWVEAKYRVSMGSLAVIRGFIKQAHESYQQAHRMFAELGDDFQLALFALGFSFTLTKMGRALEAKQICLQSLAVLRAYGARKEYLYVMNNLAMVLCATSHRKRSERILTILLRALDEEDDYYVMIIHNLAWVHLENGRYQKALEFVEKMVEINRAKKIGTEEAESCLATASKLFEGTGSHLDLAVINVYEAKIQLELGNSAESLRCLHDAIAFFSSEGFVPDLIEALELWEKAQKTASGELSIFANQAFYKARTFNRLTKETARPS